MMLYPSINLLMNKVDSRYTLVIATAKRARLIADGATPLVKCESDKPVTIAVNEIFDGKVTYTRERSLSDLDRLDKTQTEYLSELSEQEDI